ncbi:MAG: hypothetical protein KAS95_09120, partial [Candidatus Heimdallarchaeota archaeon]|nr:hypothetical protein [Candidatus Heimdallarchaeota archaeon]
MSIINVYIYLANILLTIVSSIIILTLIIPNFLKLPRKTIILIQSFLLLLSLAGLILFSQRIEEMYFFLGAACGIGFMLNGVIMKNNYKYISFIMSFISFSFVFLSLGHKILFLVTLILSHTLFISLTVFKLLKQRPLEILESKETNSIKIIKLALIIVFGTIFGYIISIIFTDFIEIITLEELLTAPIIIHSIFIKDLFIIIGAFFLFTCTTIFIDIYLKKRIKR